MVRKWPTASLKQQAYILRKEEGLSDEQIYQRFVQDGKMVLPHIPEDAQTTIDKINADVLHKHKPINHSAGSMTTPPNTSTESLSPYIAAVMKIQAAFTASELNCSVKDAMELRDRANQFDNRQDIPGWAIPPPIACKEGLDNNTLKLKTLYDPLTFQPTDDRVKGITKQQCIINAICNPQFEIVAVEAAKRHGKSTAAFVGICQGVWEGAFHKVGMWASGEDNALGILDDVFNDPISSPQTFPLFKGAGSSHQKVFFNNSFLKAYSNNAAHTSGLDFELCWIDEAHEVVVEHKAVFDMIVMAMRGKPNIKLLITMNKGTGTYAIFRDTLQKEFGKEVVFFTIEDQDIIHITEKADAKVRTLVKAVGGKDEVARWLDNKAVNTGAFDKQSIINAVEQYDVFMATTNPISAYIVESLDPSGTGHPMGLSVWAVDSKGENFWMKTGMELRLGDSLESYKIGKLTPDDIYGIIRMTGKSQRITHFITESNMNGTEAKLRMEQAGFEACIQNFGPDTGKSATEMSRDMMIHIVRNIMDNNALFFNNEDLKTEWSMYNPDKSKDSKFKGDLADSSIHAIVKLALLTNSPYLSIPEVTFDFITK